MQPVSVVLLVFVTFSVMNTDAQRTKRLIRGLHDKIDHLTELVGMYVVGDSGPLHFLAPTGAQEVMMSCVHL